MTNKSYEFHELLAYPRLKIAQSQDLFSFTIDSLLIADFVDVTKAKKIIDLGTGNAPIPLYLSLKTKAMIYGVEIQDQIFNLAKKSVEINNLDHHITLLHDNIKEIYKKTGSDIFDIVTVNPPYFKYTDTSNTNKSDELTIARHEVLITLDEIVNEAKRLLVDGGMLYMVHRVERLPELIEILAKHKFGLKQIKFVYSKKTEDAILLLLMAKKNRPSALKVLKPCYIYDEKDEYSEEMKKIFNFN